MLKEFLMEAALLKDLEHSNILKADGVVLKDKKPMIILPYMNKGSLKCLIMQTQLVSFKTLIGTITYLIIFRITVAFLDIRI